MLNYSSTKDIISRIGECVSVSGKSGQMDFMRRGAEELGASDRTMIPGWEGLAECDNMTCTLHQKNG